MTNRTVDHRKISPGIECRRFPQYVQRERTDWCGEFDRCRGKIIDFDICVDCRYAQWPKKKKNELPEKNLISNEHR